MIRNEEAGAVILDLIHTIQQNRDYLSELDGKTGDGDHGINMNKGFTLCQNKLEGKKYSLKEGLKTLSDSLIEDIGGSMGPLYGVFFDEMSVAVEGVINADTFGKMISNGINGLQTIGGAQQGDKTLLDTLIPALNAYQKALGNGADFRSALLEFKEGACKGWKETENMVARIGRSSRLGERSRGVLDAGATSCFLLMTALADAFLTRLNNEMIGKDGV